MPDKKELIAAVRDINTVLTPSPKLKLLESNENLGKSILKAIADRIGQDEKGNPVWSHPAAANLAPVTIEIYEKLLEASEINQECEAFLKSFGPKEDEVCTACGKIQECKERQEMAARLAEEPSKKRGRKKVEVDPDEFATRLSEATNPEQSTPPEELQKIVESLCLKIQQRAMLKNICKKISELKADIDELNLDLIDKDDKNKLIELLQKLG